MPIIFVEFTVFRQLKELNVMVSGQHGIGHVIGQ